MNVNKIDFEVMWLMFECFYSKSKLVIKLSIVIIFLSYVKVI